MIGVIGPEALRQWLPYAVLAVILVLRWRSISRPRPLRPALLVILPLIVAVVVGLVLLRLPALPWHWPVFAAGVTLGAGAGWQRTQLMHLERDPDTGQVMVRNSPLAFLFVLVVLAARRLFLWETGAGEGGDSPLALLGLYGSLGFALGLVCAARIELWRRATGLD